MSEPSIVLRDLVMRFGVGTANPVQAVDHVSLSLQPGEFVSLVGPSGCGKTTILKLLTGLLSDAHDGDVRVLGKPPRAGNPDIAYMLARDSLLPWRSALGNAASGMEIRNVPKAQREARALDLLRRVGLGDFSDKHPKALSCRWRQDRRARSECQFSVQRGKRRKAPA